MESTNHEDIATMSSAEGYVIVNDSYLYLLLSHDFTKLNIIVVEMNSEWAISSGDNGGVLDILYKLMTLASATPMCSYKS